MLRNALILLAVLVGAASIAVGAEFDTDVEPIFHQRCYACHGAAQQMSGLRLDQREKALTGGYSGAVIVPGDGASSKLVERISSEKEGFRMPPVGERLSAAEIAAVRAWIDAGAQWPERQAAAAPTAEQKSSHWSFQPVNRPDPPAVRGESWPRNPIDRFILAKLEAEGVEPSPEAYRTTLARRLYADLIGLPPSPEQIDRFLVDQRPDAYERLVDELLRSPHYGEKQAIEWLDLARYADSDGYERDPVRPYAWRWRDWVIDAVNRDVGFDRFTIEQIAGDLLPRATVEQRVATGFLRNGIKNREAGVKNAEKRFDETLDRVNTVGATWLGLTVGCAQCHDHKFDPISQRELYQLFAFFGNAVERDIEAPRPGEIGPYLRALPAYRAERESILAENGVPALFEQWRGKMIAAMEKPGVNTDWDFNVTEFRAANDRSDWLISSDEAELTRAERDKRIDWFLSRIGPEFSKQSSLAERLRCAREQIAEVRGDLPAIARANTMVERAKPVETHIALRGDYRAPGTAVEPGTPAALPPLNPADKPARLQLAEWLVADDNPLTPRVTVNRMWQEYFGKGLVTTPADFGIQGAMPSHPALLDWLASELVRSGWSRKEVHRLIVTSAAYRQASAMRPDLAERDPENRLLARQNRLRLKAELIRDYALAASGLLYPKIGGPSVRPPQPKGVAELGYSKKEWREETGRERYRRGLYVHFQRTAPYPMLVSFDAPGTQVATALRERSNTPLQALNLLNDPVFVEAAQALAVRVFAEAGSDPAARLDRIFRLCLGRQPSPEERSKLESYLLRQRAIFDQDSAAAQATAPHLPARADQADLATWTGLGRALMNLDGFIVRE